MPWPANWASPSPDGKLLTVVGDNLHALLLDSTSGQRVQELSGHLDYSFAAAWHPNGLYFATGNQASDQTHTSFSGVATKFYEYKGCHPHADVLKKTRDDWQALS